MKRFMENPIKSLKMKERNILKVLETYTRERYREILKILWRQTERKEYSYPDVILVFFAGCLVYHLR